MEALLFLFYLYIPHQVGTDDPVFIVGSRLPLPGNFRFVGRIIQIAVFENALSREEVVELMVVFNHLSGVNGTCIPDLKEGDRCPIPVTASSSLCDTTTERLVEEGMQHSFLPGLYKHSHMHTT